MKLVQDNELARRLARLYGADFAPLQQQVQLRIEACRERRGIHEPRTWTERDTLLITYADQIRDGARTPLAALSSFLSDEQLSDAFSAVHLLPFFPSSSDDGFSVIDYRAVDPQVGSWQDVQQLGQRFDLMFDLVLNHASRSSDWFEKYLASAPPYDKYFIDVPPRTDVSQVVRPRTHPLLTRVQTLRGERLVWTTFSADQVDLNFASPAVFAEMVDILLLYVEQGAKIIRLDAIAYLWKREGTSCIHLPETHEVVKLLRRILQLAAPDVWLLTETNVPHAENISYFGAGDEAHLVYQFSLPPLLLDALLHEDVDPLRRWLAQLATAPPAATFLNFTASHDGIGVRPLQGLVSVARFNSLVDKVRQRGGLVSTKRDVDGRESPYELNITYFDALAEPDQASIDVQVKRFLISQAIMLALQGIPAVYFHSLVATPNDIAGVEESGHARRINRHRYTRASLDQALAAEDAPQGRVFEQYRAMLRIRRQQPAFAPRARQRVLMDLPDTVIGFQRDDGATGQSIVVLANVNRHPQRVTLPAPLGAGPRDLLSGRAVAGPVIALEPLEVLWLADTK